MNANYQALANAIVWQAVQDYMCAARRLSRRPGNTEALRVREELRSFFRSDYFQLLTDTDPTYLLHRLERGDDDD